MSSLMEIESPVRRRHMPVRCNDSATNTDGITPLDEYSGHVDVPSTPQHCSPVGALARGYGATWESHGIDELRPYFMPFGSRSGLALTNEPTREPFVFSPRAKHLVDQLIASFDDIDAFESKASDIQVALMAGDSSVCIELYQLIHDDTIDVDIRSQLIQTLAASRSQFFGRIILEVVLAALESEDSEIRFAGVACLSELTRPVRIILRPYIESLKADQVQDIRSAINAYLRVTSCE